MRPLYAKDEDISPIYKEFLNRTKYEKLTKEEEYRLIVLAQGQDQEAQRQLVGAYMRYAVRLARRFSKQGVLFDDLVSAANLGLLEAIEHFDLERNNRFTTCLSWYVRRTIYQEFGKAHMIRLPLATQQLLRDEADPKRKRKLTERHKQLIAKAKQALSWQGESAGDGIGEGFDPDTIPSPEREGVPNPGDIEQQYAEALHYLKELTKREQRVLSLRFGFDQDGQMRTLEAVGAIMGITRERVRQLQLAGLQRIKQRFQFARQACTHPSPWRGVADESLLSDARTTLVELPSLFRVAAAS